ncbi:MAG: hypothetical protein ABSC51_12240, partial [Gaiellaceae bacterium]
LAADEGTVRGVELRHHDHVQLTVLVLEQKEGDAVRRRRALEVKPDSRRCCMQDLTPLYPCGRAGSEVLRARPDPDEGLASSGLG